MILRYSVREFTSHPGHQHLIEERIEYVRVYHSLCIQDVHRCVVSEEGARLYDKTGEPLTFPPNRVITSNRCAVVFPQFEKVGGKRIGEGIFKERSRGRGIEESTTCRKIPMMHPQQSVSCCRIESLTMLRID